MKETMIIINWVLLVFSVIALFVLIMMAFGGISHPFIAIASIIVIIIGLNIYNSTIITEYKDIKVIDKQQQQLIKKESTDYRYLVITDKETFICESSLINGKFNNSDLFWRIKKDSTYKSIKVAGLGKGIFFDYKNILEIN